MFVFFARNDLTGVWTAIHCHDPLVNDLTVSEMLNAKAGEVDSLGSIWMIPGTYDEEM